MWLIDSNKMATQGISSPSVASEASDLSTIATPPPKTPGNGRGEAILNPIAKEFTPVVGRKDPTPLSPDMVPPENRRESLESFKWPSKLVSSIPFNSNKSLFKDDMKTKLRLLCTENQAHVFDQWDGLGKNDDKKKAFMTTIKNLDETYPGGIRGYLENARKLLKEAAEGKNPLDGWVPEVPKGAELIPGTYDFKAKETLGLKEIGKVGFVLVAGGLGERLGYSGIKIGLPTESTTGCTYIELYCKQIKAIQDQYCTEEAKLSLAIMVSGDTADRTAELLKANDNFGIDITIIQQEKVLALADSDAKISMAGPYEADAKPHGHGDVHVLMHSKGVAAKWASEGKKWVAFFQDTNGLAFATLAAVLGVSADLDLEVNSVCVPRFAKQAVGAIAKLVNKDEGKTMTCNVEYNQLDPLLRATINPDGDVNDPTTGKSIFPGNINQLIFALEPYVEVLKRTEGVVAEFVNPKYTDETKTAFKKPTRLECMMQDYAKVLEGDSAEKVGFTMFPSWICYSPCKNNVTDAAASVKKGVPAASAWTAESDQYNAAAQLMRTLGCNVEEGAEREFLSIPAVDGPRVIIDPATALFSSEYAKIFPFPNRVKVSARSTLVLEGDVVVEALELDGALVAKAKPGDKLRIVAYGEEGKIVNDGHILESMPEGDAENVPEVVKMRGFIVKKIDETVVDTTLEHAHAEFVYAGNKLVADHLFEDTYGGDCKCLC